MRKLFLLLSFIVSMIQTARAIDELHVVPFETQAGITENEWEKSFSVNMNNNYAFRAIQFDIYLPEGMSLIEQEPIELNSDRFPGQIVKKVWQPYHTISITYHSEGYYKVILMDMTQNREISGNEGEAMRMFYLTSPDMAPGIYPIKISTMILGIDSHNKGESPKYTTSYVKIGEPTNANLSLGGYVASDVSQKLNDETGIGTLDLADVTSFNGTLILKDNANFVPPTADVKVENIIYNRSMSSKWGTICLPFATTSNDDVQYYRLREAIGTTLKFDPTSSLEAGEPAIFNLKNGNELSIKANDVTVCSGTKEKNEAFEGWTMKGTYTSVDCEPTDNSIYYMKNDNFIYAENTVNQSPFNAWFECTKETATPAFGINTEYNPDGITNVFKENNATVIFDISGRKHTSLQDGVNIVNGKKFFK